MGVKPVKALNAVEKYAGVLNPTIEDISDMGSSPCLRSFSASLKRTAFMKYREELLVISVIRTCSIVRISSTARNADCLLTAGEDG